MGALFFIGFLAFAVLGLELTFVGHNKEGELEFPTFGWGGIPWLAVAGAFFIATLSWTTVDAGSVGIIKLFGNPTGQLEPGGHLINPMATVTTVPVQTRIVKTSENASSSDLQVVFAEVTLAYHVDPRYATDILVQLNNDAETRVIVPAILESIKAETAQYEVQALVKNRATVRDGIENRVKARLQPYHIIPETVSITNFNFSTEYEASIEAKQVAEQQAEKAKNDLERIKVQAQQQVAQAEGEAAALRAQREQVTPELLQLRMVEMLKAKWDGHLPDTYFGGQAPLPVVDAFKNTPKR